MKYSEEELAGLSETEREALTAIDEEDGADTGTSDDGADDDQGDGSDNQTSDEEDNSQGDDPPIKDIAAPVVIAVVDSDDFDIDSVAAVAFVPKLSGVVLPHYEERLAALDTQLEEGELPTADYRREVRKLEAQSQNEEIAGQLWQAEQVAFAKAQGFKSITDYQTKAPEDYAAMSAEVLKIINDPTKSGISGIQTLYMARHNLQESAEFAEFKAARKAGKTTVAAKEKEVLAKPAATRPNIKTLRNIPSADAPDVGQDKFAYLDKLSGMALEKAISKLPPDEYAAYVSGV